MSIDRRDHILFPRRPARLVAAGLFAVLTLAIAVTPALAVVTPPPPDAPTAAPADGPGQLAPSPDAAVAAAATASPSPTASPEPSPSPDPSPDPTPSPTPTPTPAPTPTLTPQPTPPWPSTVTTVGSTVRFYGRGNGHGVGMSQWGARGRALAGQTAAQILAAYFHGSSAGVTGPTRAVRVLVLAGLASTASAPLSIHGRTGAWTVDGVKATFPADARLTAWRTTAAVKGISVTTWHLRIVGADGATVLYTGTPAGQIVIRPAGTATRLELDSKASKFDTYRGRLTVLLGKSSASVVNTLGLDDYLKGVIPVEMPATWPVEALKAQVVVARSWTVRHLHPTTGTFDVYDDTRSQIYRGVRAESSAVNRLIAAAPGALAMYGTTVVNAFYCSAAGGWTEDNEDAFVPANGVIGSAPLPYLRGVDDRAPSGTAYDAAAPGYAWTTASITHARLNAILAADPRTSVGTVLRLDLRHRGASGRLYQVVVYGSTGTKIVSGDVFRLVFNAHRPAGTPAMLSNLFNTAPLP